MGILLPVALPKTVRPGDALTLSVRPEKLELFTAPQRAPALEGRVRFVRDLGQRTETYIDVQGAQLIAVSSVHAEVNAPVWVGLPPEHCTVFCP
jgi:ABC-type Fe3+/spermidine/putrescine transport system ATPase subunit